METVAAFTDTYLPTVNGVSYTIKTWRDRWSTRGGRMDVVFPGAPEYDPEEGEYPIRSVEFPFYDDFRFGIPGVPDAVRTAAPDLIHAHTPFALGLSALYLARQLDVPLVGSYHTPTAEYADYLVGGRIAAGIEWLAKRYERWYLNRADALIVPSVAAADHLRTIGVGTTIRVVPNGVDTDTFAPVDPDEQAAFRDRHELPSGPLVGYTGRHGFEKDLESIIPAVEQADVDVTLVFGGDGPARETLEGIAREHTVDVRFLGFLDREELPAFYSCLDAFLFPSPVETQGLVALEANACGTPVVGVEEGALEETIVDGETGYHFESGDRDAFAAAIERVLRDSDRLRAGCLERREENSVERAIDRLAEVYQNLT